MARSGALYVVALVVAAAAVALARTTQASFFCTDEDLASDDSMWALYERWAAHHEVVPETSRFPIFKNNARWIRDRYGSSPSTSSAI